MSHRYSTGYQVFKVCNIVFMLVMIVVTLSPVLNVIAKSFSDMKNLAMNNITLYPRGFNTKSYALLMKDTGFWIDYRNTLVYTSVGTAISLALTTMLAYSLSVPRLKGKKFFINFVIFTMFFGGGLVPNYLLVRNLGMRNTIWAIVVPGAVSSFLTLVMKTFFLDIPRELEEAAEVDGMSTFGILLKIILPLSKPIIATMILMYAVGAWNSWFGASIYLDKPHMFPVSLYLRNVIAGANTQIAGADTDTLNQVSQNLKATCIVLTALPIMCIYPRLQKYFVQGVMLGSVKG